MDADWDELRIVPHYGSTTNPTPHLITAFAFDNSQELLWAGSHLGRVTSFYGPELQRYTAYRGHYEHVKQILFHDKGVISVSARSVHMALRTGPAIWHIADPNFQDLQCMSFTSKGTHELLVAGGQDTMFKIDVEKGEITQTLPSEDKYSLMRRSGSYICAANFTGAVHIIDPGSLKVVHVWQAHKGIITDMDAKADYLVTCGLSPRQQHGLLPDPLANVLHLKTLTPLPPIPFQPGAAFVRMHPRMSSTSIVASQTGQMQVVDIMNPHTVNLKQARIFDNDYALGMDLAPSGEALALSSSMCNFHLWGKPTSLKFAEFSNPTVFPDPQPPDMPMEWSDPLNSVGMPYYREQLLSVWPSMVFEVGGVPPKVDPELAPLLKRNEIGYYAVNPRKVRPNVIEYSRNDSKSNATITAPKFLSEKARDMSYAQEDPTIVSNAVASLNDLVLDGSYKKDIPNMYRNVEIKYSRFGVDDFDFEFYNRTDYSGLETHIANSYTNSLLQLYRFTPILRNLALRHTSTYCLFMDCLLCQLGFLIDMLEKAAGQNCQASNFLKTFSGLPNTAHLNILEEHSPNNPLTVMIQSANRFFLEKLSQDFRSLSNEPYLEQALATNSTQTIRCAVCSHEQMRPQAFLVHDLVYPSNLKAILRSPRNSRHTFSQILKASVERQEHMRGWCPNCRRYQQVQSRRQVLEVPPVLMINAMVQSPDVKQLWSHSNFLPKEIGIIATADGQFYCYQDQDLKLHLHRGVHKIQVYELIGVVADVNSGEKEKPHLVSLINVSVSSPEHIEEDQWHVFNDFLVHPATEEELRFDPTWKMPSVIAYQLKSARHHIDDGWRDNLDTSVLYRQISPQQEEDPDHFQLLNEDETPQPGTLVGIDAEFVSLQSEEIEIKADGTRETIRPSRLGLARVSVLRGDGLNKDLPFIDDYIAVTEPVVDYLTAYSGIHPGDLTTGLSRHVLVSLKVAYKKLWLLLNLGCVFVGHGLLKDFRTINIHVPRGQVIDTVDLWFIPSRGRKLNLRYLAWYLLNENIQMDTHDSIEDARTALRLARKYNEVRVSGKMEETLENIYKKGKEVGFRAPNAAGTVFPAPTDTGRNTPELAVGGDSRPGTGAGTPVKKGQGTGDRAVFGSPLKSVEK